MKTNRPEPLRSDGITRVFLVVMGMGALLHMVSILIISRAIVSPSSYLNLMNIDILQIGCIFLGEVFSFLLLLIWLMLILADLRRLDPAYDTKRSTELLRLWLPVYNLYGVWRTLRELAEFFKAGGGEMGKLGDRMQFQFLAISMSCLITRYFVPLQANEAFSMADNAAAIYQLLTRIWGLVVVLFYIFYVRKTTSALRLSEIEQSTEMQSV
ncbi:MAG: hypothetical protein GY835_07780 [bacterium]|nr:hypothetical protein [bacterium]